MAEKVNKPTLSVLMFFAFLSKLSWPVRVLAYATAWILFFEVGTPWRFLGIPFVFASFVEGIVWVAIGLWWIAFIVVSLRE